MEVTSEILPFFERDTASKPTLNTRNIISRFVFTCNKKRRDGADCQAVKDADGDYVLERNCLSENVEEVITLEHSMSTEMNLVGLQIWRGALLLADFILHSQADFKDKTVLEVGAGVGLTSVVASMFAKKIICTDINLGDILNLIKTNLKRNRHVGKAEVDVCELDFFGERWSPKVEEHIKQASIILAADVIYDNDVTEAFVRTLEKIMGYHPNKSVYIALEKRYVFTISDLDSVAPCYEHLLTCLAAAQRRLPNWIIEQIPIDFPQSFNYERVKQLVLIKISLSE